MPNESQLDPRTHFVPRYLPWLLGGVMLVVYCATLNHWVTLLNLSQVAAVAGWTWRPQTGTPLGFLATYPFHWLPAASIPLALNLFSAVCAAGTMAVLARTVAILPHDRTEMERTRERSDFSFLTGWVAWAPPVVGVVFAGLQLVFWEHATSFSGESFDLLVFAIILWQVLEYRLDEREGRLFLAAFLYGASLTENWAMVGYLPVFLTMLIWQCRLDFFRTHFLVRLILSGLAGLLLFLLLVVPLLSLFSGMYSEGYWPGVKSVLRNNWQTIRLISYENIRHHLGLVSLTSLLPAFIISIRWSATFGDSSRIGAALVNYMMHGVNLVLLGVLVSVTLDAPFSPGQLLQDAGLNVTGLTFNYIVALCLSYFCGYLLLVFGKSPLPTRRTSKPTPALPKELMWLCPLILAGMAVVLVGGAGALIGRNAPLVRAMNDDSLLKYAQFTSQTLPKEGAIVLSDSDNPSMDLPIHTYLQQAILAREGRAQNLPVVDTQSLNWAPYHQYLHRHFPKIWPATYANANQTNGLSPLQILTQLNELSQSNHIYYLNPSFGYYFERFYQEPHGLTYALRTLPEDTLLPPALGAGLITENESFWAQVVNHRGPDLERSRQAPANNAFRRMTDRLHLPTVVNPNALLADGFYSRGMNWLGVQLQRAGKLDQAALLFSNACWFNSNNVSAKINQAFNHTLTAGLSTATISPVTADQFGQSHDMNEVLTANGPFDETSFCFETAFWYLRGGLRLEAVAPLTRVCQLAPDNLVTRFQLAQIYDLSRLPNRALEVLHEPLTHPAQFGLNLDNSTALNVLASAAYLQKNQNDAAVKLLEKEMDRHPDDETLMFVCAQVFNSRGLYTNALRIIDRKLLRAPDDPTWLYGKGYLSLQIGALQDAITALNRYLQIQTNNPAARFDRALAYYQSDQLEAARADFLNLQATHTNSFQIAYGLAEVSWRQRQTNEAIRNYRIYLANAPTNNAAEIQNARDHLSQLGAK